MNTIHFNGSDETVELILGTVISVKQLSVHGAAADACGELARDSKGTGRPGATEDLESLAIPTEFPTTDQIPQTDADVQGNLLRGCDSNFDDLPEQERN